jgi:hypothetical protein
LQVVGFLAGVGCLLGRCRFRDRVCRGVLLTALVALGVTLLAAPTLECPCIAALGLSSIFLTFIALTPPCREWSVDPYARLYASD